MVKEDRILTEEQPPNLSDQSPEITALKALLVLSSAFCLLVNCLYYDQAWACAFGFASYVLFLVYQMAYSRNFVIKYCWILVITSLWAAGVLICNTQDLYMNELSRYTAFNGSFLPCLAFCFGIICFMKYFDGRISNEKSSRRESSVPVSRILEKVKRLNGTWVLLAMLAIGIVVFLMILNVSSRPFFLVGGNRGAYAAEMLSSIPIGKTVLYWFIPISIMCYLIGWRFVPVAYIGLVVLYLLLIGEKFSGLFIVAYLCVIIALSISTGRVSLSLRKYRCVVVGLLVLACLLVGVIFFQYGVGRGFSVDEVMRYIFARVACQGELWWGMFNTSAIDASHMGEFVNEFGIDDKEAGIYKIMYLTGDVSYIDFVYSLNSVYTQSTQASVLYYFGWVGVAIWLVIVAGIYCLLINALIKASSEFRIVESIILVKFVLQWNEITAMSDFGFFASWQFFILVFAYIAARWFSESIRERFALVQQGKPCFQDSKYWSAKPVSR